MKKFAMLFAVAAAVIPAFAAGEADLIRNGDFQELKSNGQPAVWGIQKWRKPETIKGSVVAGKAGAEDRALLLESTDKGSYLVVTQRLALKSNTTYVYSFDSRSENIVSDKAYDGGSVLIECSGKVISSYSVPRKDAAGWISCKRTFKTGKLPENASSRIMLIMRNGTGKVAFDNVSVKEVPAK